MEMLAKSKVREREWRQERERTQFSLFRSQVKNRRLNDGALRILELVLVSKDVKSLLEVRSSLREFLQSKSVSVMREIRERTIEQKLLILEFFVHAFAICSHVRFVFLPHKLLKGFC